MKRRTFLKLLGLSVIAPKIGMEIVDNMPKPDEWDNTAWYIPEHNEYHVIYNKIVNSYNFLHI